MTSETSTNYSGAWFLVHTQKSKSYHQWWLYEASLVSSEDAWRCPGTSACGAPSDHHSAVLAPFCADFPHTQIFGDNLLNTFLFHIQLTRNHSNSQATIATYHLHYSLNVDLCPACRRLLVFGISFHFLHTLLNLYCHSKTRVRDMVLSPYTCWSISRAGEGVFFQPDQNFHVYSLVPQCS